MQPRTRTFLWRLVLGLMVSLLFPAGYLVAMRRAPPEPAFSEVVLSEVLVRSEVDRLTQKMVDASILSPHEQRSAVLEMFTHGIDAAGFDIILQWGCPDHTIILEVKRR